MSPDVSRNLKAACIVAVAAIAVAVMGMVGYFVMHTPDVMRPARTDLSNRRDIREKKLNTVRLPIQRPDWTKVDDPKLDGWTSEIQAKKIKKILGRVVEHLISEQHGSSESVQTLAAEDFTGESLIPRNVVKFESAPFRMEWFDGGAGEPLGEAKQQWQRRDGLAGMIREYRAAWTDAELKHSHVKVIGIARRPSETPTERIWVAQARISISGTIAGLPIEQNTTWSTRWRESGETLLLIELRVIEFEQVKAERRGSRFTDITSHVLERSEHLGDQFTRGLNHWLLRNQDMRYFAPLGNPGLVVGDVDGDGMDDLYVCQESQLPNRLFLQQSDGRVRELAESWKVDWLEGSRSALLIDLDNDADQDLAVAILGGVVLAENRGDHFVVRDVLPTDDDTMSLSAADFDLDGRLDIYVCVGYPNDYFSEDNAMAIQGGAANRVYHDARNAGRNSLFRNKIRQGEWVFEDITEQVGLQVNRDRYSFAAAWEDFDNDGDQDLYVANDFGPNSLYRNDAGSFVDVARELKVEDTASGMSVDWSDVDGDGWVDLHIGNMFSSAGRRITSQAEFKRDDPDVRRRIQRFARGNTLLRNAEAKVFEDISLESSVYLGRWAWSSVFLDVNNDSRDDLIVANGYITNDDSSDL